ncbi:hypothetical protein AN218_22790 [Streptomyces nanshensis]|uniref:Uncharacterized protein n=1 Tax=Streptomyces nanshensis TaxID=518642 RepID=A0A1E7KZC3_9ACTN|nr:hypothetical protein AN218_22790 [Streptomyces nanshensis]
MRRFSSAGASSNWPRRGDLAHDKQRERVGVVVSLPEDTESHLYHLRPVGGGDEWASTRDDLEPHSDAAEDGLTLAEAVMPPDDGEVVP